MTVFGVGPFYVITCLVLTILGIAMKNYGYLDSGNLKYNGLMINLIGILLIIEGIIIWIYAVLIQKITDEIKNGRLVTTGVYSIVRNPIYSAFTFIFTGIILIQKNIFLLILPFIFWIFLTFLLKKTEEIWLEDIFGQEYKDYCLKVNRVIPWKRYK